jgi:hypothetical protein
VRFALSNVVTVDELRDQIETLIRALDESRQPPQQ